MRVKLQTFRFFYKISGGLEIFVFAPASKDRETYPWTVQA
jgi:hypothetical protein